MEVSESAIRATGWPMWTRVALAASAGLAAAEFMIAGWALGVAAALGLGLAIFGRWPLWRWAKAHSDAGGRQSGVWRTRSAAGLTRLALIVVHLCLGWTVVQAGRNYVRGQIVEQDLTHIGRSLRLELKERGDFPETLADLMLGGYCICWQLESPFDPDVYWWPNPQLDPIRVTYVYRPGRAPWRSDGELILAHDPQPYSRVAPRLIQPGGRFVLFADERVEWMREAEFAAALKRDEARRQEIGWPTTFPAQPERRIPRDLPRGGGG